MTRAWILPALAAALAATGCAEGPPPLQGINIQTVPAQGKVLLANGQPLKGGIVTFEPIEGSTNQAAAPVKEDGTFELQSGPSHPGAMPGKYRVKVENENGSKTLTKDAKKIIEVDVPSGGASDLVIKLP